MLGVAPLGIHLQHGLDLGVARRIIRSPMAAPVGRMVGNQDAAALLGESLKLLQVVKQSELGIEVREDDVPVAERSGVPFVTDQGNELARGVVLAGQLQHFRPAGARHGKADRPPST